MQLSQRVMGWVIVACLGITVLVWSVVREHESTLTISIIASGTGAVEVVRDPSNATMILGGGADAGMLRSISSVLPWYQHSVEALLLPQLDTFHTGGAIDILRRYTIPLIIMPASSGMGPEWASLQDVLKELPTHTQKQTLIRGTIISMSIGARVEVVYPDRLMPHADSKTGCAILRVVYGDTTILIMCDINPAVIPYLTFLDGHGLHSNVLILPESLFKSDNARLLLGFVAPTSVVVTHSCKNPIATITKIIIQKFNAKITDPCVGSVKIESDGSNFNVY